jgi:hypothetical protein
LTTLSGLYYIIRLAKFGIVSSILLLLIKIAHKTFIYFPVTKLLNLAGENSIKSIVKLNRVLAFTGTALAIKTMRPEVLVIGVEPENCQSFSTAMKVHR